MGVSAYRKRITMKQDYFDRVYEKTHRSLLKYAIVHLSDPTDAEDTLQNVYVEFYRRIERYGHLDILLPDAFLKKMLKREIIRNYKEREQRRLHLCETAEEAPQVFINGVPLKHEGEIDPLSSICGYVSKDQHRIGYMMLGAATADLPEMFTLTVTWHGETAEIRLKLSDVIREKSAQSETYYDEVFDY